MHALFWLCLHASLIYAHFDLILYYKACLNSVTFCATKYNEKKAQVETEPYFVCDNSRIYFDFTSAPAERPHKAPPSPCVRLVEGVAFKSHKYMLFMLAKYMLNAIENAMLLYLFSLCL